MSCEAVLLVCLFLSISPSLLISLCLYQKQIQKIKRGKNGHLEWWTHHAGPSDNSGDKKTKNQPQGHMDWEVIKQVVLIGHLEMVSLLLACQRGQERPAVGRVPSLALIVFLG